MGFEAPWMLLGLAAAAVPVALHLLHRRHARRVPFAALEFLLVSDKRLARRLRLKQLLVLALRVALLAALALALAKPYVADDPTAAQDVARPGLVALVVDDSGSMRAHPAGGPESLLDRALARARALVEAAGPQTRVAVVTAARPAHARTPKATLDHAELTRVLSGIYATALPGELPEALRAAERVLAASAADLGAGAASQRRQVLVLSDQAVHAWRHVEPPWALGDPPEVHLLDLRDGATLDNQAVVGASFEPAERRATVEVANFAGEEREVRVTVSVDEAEASGSVSVPGGAHRTLALTLPPGAGGPGLGRVHISPGGALADDDRWFFTTQRTSGLRVGLVDGAPRDVSYLDELFFLDAALRQAGADGGARVSPRWLGLQDLGRADLSTFDAIVLANPPALSRGQAQALRDYVEAGGGLLLTCGDNARAEDGTGGPTSHWAHALMPLPIRSVKTVARRDDPAAAARALGVGPLAPDHALTEDLETVLEVGGPGAETGDAHGGGLAEARVYSYCLLDAQARPGVTVLAQLTNGAPLLVARGQGRGRILQWTTSIDRDWTDLPVRPAFVPLVDRLVLWLAGRLDAGAGTSDRGLRAGDRLQAAPPPGAGRLTLQRPDGVEVPIPEPPPGEPASLGPAPLTGFYTLRRAAGAGARPAPPVTLAVNAPPAESDLRLADLDAVRAALAGDRARDRTGAPGEERATAGRTAGDESAPPTHRRGLWGGLLLALFALLAAEGWVALRA